MSESKSEQIARVERMTISEVLTHDDHIALRVVLEDRRNLLATINDLLDVLREPENAMELRIKTMLVEAKKKAEGRK